MNLSEKSNPETPLAQTLKLHSIMRIAFPSRTIMLLLGIGILDMIVTAVLHAQGLIVEMNPLMKVFIERSEWLFVFVKSLTLVCGWLALAWYFKQNENFVRKVCVAASGAYVGVWIVWFTLGSMPS